MENAAHAPASKINGVNGRSARQRTGKEDADQALPLEVSDSTKHLQAELKKYDQLALCAIRLSNVTVLGRVEMQRWKFVVAETKLFSYMFFFAFSAWALQDQWDWFWDPSKQHLVTAEIPWRLKGLYFMETAHYLYTLIAMFFEPKMKDRVQMVFHHVFTITLLGTSYYSGTLRYGTTIMVLHDFSDPWMEAAKLFNYSAISWAANLCFVVFATSFVYLRVYIFPTYIISATYNYARPAGYPFYGVTFVSLVGLWVLHCIWTYMIWRVFYNSVVLGQMAGDVREDDD